MSKNSVVDNYRFKEFHELTYDWLTMTGNKVDKQFLKYELSSHADYPALTSLTDLLDSGNLSYQAVRAGFDNIHDFNYPVIAHIHTPSNSQGVVVVNNANEWGQEGSILQAWSGITIFADKGSQWTNDNNTQAIKKGQRNTLFTAAYIFIIGSLVSYCLFSTSNTIFTLWYVLSCIGMLISFLTVGNELGVQNQVIKKVCGTTGDRGCDKILKSRYSRGLFGVSLSDLSVAYFGAQIVTLFLIYLNPSYYLLHHAEQFLSYFGIVVALWSIATQRFILKEWCPFCIGIISVLTCQFIIAVFNYQAPTVVKIAEFGAIVGVLLLLELPVRQLAAQLLASKPQIAELKKWKTNKDIFMSLLAQQEKVDITPWNDDLQIGNPDAGLQITVACNPYCNPCARAHKVIDRLLERYSDNVGVCIRFAINASNANDKRTEAINLILNRARAMTAEQKKVLLSDWFEHMNKEHWLKHYPVEQPEYLHELLQLHQDWVKQANVSSTPTIFINGWKLPGIYSVEDVLAMAPLLIAEFATETNYETLN